MKISFLGVVGLYLLHFDSFFDRCLFHAILFSVTNFLLPIITPRTQ